MVRTGCTLAAGLLIAVAGCNGGSGRAEITRVPRWNFQQYQRIAVLPTQCADPRAKAAAEQLTYMLTDLLGQNPTFTVVSRTELKDVLTEQDLSRLAEVADPSTALPEGKIQAAQALVVGSITGFTADREAREVRVPRYALDRRGRPRVVGEDVYMRFRHWARVGGSVRVIDAATGKLLFTHTAEPVEHESAQRGAPPRAMPQELAIEAAKELAVDFYKHVAPIRTRVKLKGDMLIIALDYYEGKYDTTKKVPTEVEKFMLVVRGLPPECDRNDFRVAITEAEGRQNLFEQEFIWSAADVQRGKVFDVPMATLTATGGMKFVAKLYSGNDPAPILKREFELKPGEHVD